MRCRDVQRQLPDYLRGHASGPAHADISGHLSVCHACRAEAQQLSSLFLEIDRANSWEPSDNYWASVLPRIHQHAGKKPDFQFTGPALRFALPLSAALALTILLVRFVPTEFAEQPADVQSLIRQLPPEQIQELADQQSVTDVAESRSASNDSALVAADDVDLIRELLQNDEQIDLPADAYVDTEDLTGSEANELVSILEKQAP